MVNSKVVDLNEIFGRLREGGFNADQLGLVFDAFGFPPDAREVALSGPKEKAEPGELMRLPLSAEEVNAYHHMIRVAEDGQRRAAGFTHAAMAEARRKSDMVEALVCLARGKFWDMIEEAHEIAKSYACRIDPEALELVVLDKPQKSRSAASLDETVEGVLREVMAEVEAEERGRPDTPVS